MNIETMQEMKDRKIGKRGSSEIDIAMLAIKNFKKSDGEVNLSEGELSVILYHLSTALLFKNRVIFPRMFEDILEKVADLSRE